MDERDTGQATGLNLPAKLATRLHGHVERIYPHAHAGTLVERIAAAFFGESRLRRRSRVPGNSLWSQKDAFVITYGSSVIDGEHVPLDLLHDFLLSRLKGVVTGVHILPFFPWTSDDGFAVTDYRSVDSRIGDWHHVNRIAGDFKLMADLVLNHVSSQGPWFSQYRQGQPPYDRFFFEASPEDDLSEVVRPRTSPLLREVDTANGVRHVWCTFSHDQVDLDFSNPEVLLEFLRIMRFHIDHGVRVIRLDAVAFIWKEIGTSCIHLPQTHEIVRLMRTLCDFADEPVVLITETNVPNFENLSYFGNRNEAHAIYNFPLPPLVVHAMLAGTARYLNAWQMAMPPAQLGCAYLNFVASHDGIGVRPAEGLLSDEEIAEMIEAIRGFGGRVSMRRMSDGSDRPYEINTTLFDAFKGTLAGEDEFQVERLVASQTLMMALEGIPAFYIHALLGTPNDNERAEKTGHFRSLNRHQWDYGELNRLLDDPATPQARALSRICANIRIRARQPAFHPNATQFTLQLGENLFGFWRQSLDRDQSIFAIHNVTARPVDLPVLSLNLIGGEQWRDLLGGEAVASETKTLTLAPYRCVWISNRIY